MLTNAKNVLSLVKRYIPDGPTIFNTREVDVESTETVQLMGRHWQKGYNNRYIFVNLENGESDDVPEPIWKNMYEARLVSLRKEYVVICYSFFGMSGRITMYVHPSQLNSFIEVG